MRNIKMQNNIIDELGNSQLFLQSILDEARLVIYVKDLEGRHAFVNKKFEIVTGISKKDAIGKTNEELFPPEVAEIFSKNDKVVMGTGKPLMVEEFVLSREGKRIFMTQKFAIRNTAGEVYALCGMSTDITDSKKTEEAVKQSEKKYRAIFDTAAVSLWEEDFSEVKKLIDGIKAKGVTNFKQYLDENPDFVARQ